jgi:hypothetical protein
MVVDPEMLPEVAWIMDDPVFTAVAKPELLIVATVGAPEVHVTEDVRSLVDPSVLWPVAVNCCVPDPVVKLIDGFAGVTVMDCSGAVCTVTVVVPVTPPEVAVIVAVPAAMPLANPEELIVAVADEEENHAGERLFVLPSL